MKVIYRVRCAAVFLACVLLLQHVAELNLRAASTPPNPEQWVATANDEWKPADQGDIEVIRGSALDLSQVFQAPAFAGADGFSMINEKGQLAFKNKPEKVIRFRCATVTPTHGTPATSSLYSKEECDMVADQMVKGGYNLCRPHMLDLTLMEGSQEDLVMNPERLDRWDYFAAALKKRGIYLYMDAITTGSAFYAVDKPWTDAGRAKNLSNRMYYDETARAHWKEGVKRLFTHVNPYTGVALKDEPQVVVVQLRNEAGLNFQLQFPDRVTPDLEKAFRSWLKQRYGTTEKLKEAWTSKVGDALVSCLPAGKTIETVGWPTQDGSAPNSRDLQRFITDIERETAQWMSKTIREIGVKVPLIEYNNGYALETSLARDVMELVDNHAYHDHPTKFILPGSSLGGASCMEDGVGYFQYMAGTRQLGRPFFCSEWGQVFWNPYRYESGLTLPCYASLQGWQMIAQYSHPIQIGSREAIKSFAVYLDPPLRASEYMSAFFFRRGDVQESAHTIEVNIDPAALPENVLLQYALSGNITHLALVSKLGIRILNMPDSARRAKYQADWSVTPYEGDRVLTREGVQEVAAGKNVTILTDFISQLRGKGILDASNKTSVDQGIYQSDTGQILLNETKRQIQILTSKSLGVSLAKASTEIKIGPVTACNLGANAGFFLTSLTDQPLQDSGRLLLLLPTDALNSGMTFENEKRLKLVSLGNFPVLLQVAKLKFSLNHKRADKLKMWALSANGQRREEIPLTVANGAVSGVIDTSKLANGPTPYFELQVQTSTD